MVINIFFPFADVLALAAAIGELSAHTRRARTSQWSALQMSSNDMPDACKRVISAATGVSKFACSRTNEPNFITACTLFIIYIYS